MSAITVESTEPSPTTVDSHWRSEQRSGANASDTTSPPQKSKQRRRKGTQANDDDDQTKRRCVSTACIACRKRKSKCDGNTPACAACSQVYNTECIYDPGSDHRRKGVYRNELDNLKTRSTTLHTLISAILNYPENEVADLVKEIRTCESLDVVADRIVANEHGHKAQNDSIHDEDHSMVSETQTPTFESNLYGKMGDLRLEEGALRYIGGTSNLIHVDEDDETLVDTHDYLPHSNPILSWTEVTDDAQLITHLLDMYFTWHYTYFTTLSKSLFYKDFEFGKLSSKSKRRSQYCSSLLVNAMLALGCHFTAHSGARDVEDDSATAGDHFFREAKRLLMEDDELERPRLTTIQALALMSVREAGCGREARGWVYSGMSFRMAQDMGLHLDAGQLSSHSTANTDDVEEDARRITFWGCFLFDKCWSNYLGRLPQLPLSLITTPKFEVFPEEDAAAWVPYTDSGFTQSSSQPSRTRAVALQIAKLCEISNDLMQSFYNPSDMDKTKARQIELKKLSDIHTRLETWRRELPIEMEPREGGLPSVIVMHMFFQLLFIHLFRPFLRYTQATSPLPSNVSPRKLCTQAAALISKLLRLYRRSHGLRQICNIAVYIAHSACTIHLLNLPDKNARRDITHGVKHLEEIAEGWLCARRSLGILGLLANKWSVELPYEAEAVLQRIEAKFGPFKRDAQSPDSDAHHVPHVSMSSGYATVQIPMSSSYQTTHNLQSSLVTPAQSADQRRKLGTGSVASAAVPTDAAALLLHQYPYASGTPGSVSRFNTAMPTPATSAGSPSGMFGGIDQLLRDSQDWAYRDQAQLGLGFGNWNGTADEPVGSWFRPKATAGASHHSPTQRRDGSDSATYQRRINAMPITSSLLPAAGMSTSVNGSFAEPYEISGHDITQYDAAMHYDEDEWYQ